MKKDIILTTTENIPGIEYEIIGICIGNKLTWIRSKKASFGALEHLREEAENMNADAVVAIRPDTTPTGSQCYIGTAVRFKK